MSKLKGQQVDGAYLDEALIIPGLEKKEDPPAADPKPASKGAVFKAYKSKNPVLCDECVVSAVLINGVPKNSLNRARHIRLEDGVKTHLCGPHYQDIKNKTK